MVGLGFALLFDHYYYNSTKCRPLYTAVRMRIRTRKRAALPACAPRRRRSDSAAKKK